MTKLFYKEETYEKTIFHIFGIRIKLPPRECYCPKASNDSKIKISVVINTYNAERLLEKAIKSVINADEIIVCDMHSTDSTIEIAKKYNCKIVYHEKLPQPDPARNFAISQASGDWILILDADEIVPKDLWEYLVNYSNNPIPEKLAVSFARKNWFMDGFLEHADADYQLRFFKKGCIHYETGHVHVPPKTVGTDVFNVPNIDGKNLVLYHYSVADFNQFLNRQNIYTSEEVKKADLSKIEPSKVKFLSVFCKHLNIYLKSKMYKDGLRGLVWCVYDMFYEITVYMKLLEAKEKYSEKLNVDADSKIQL